MAHVTKVRQRSKIERAEIAPLKGAALRTFFFPMRWLAAISHYGDGYPKPLLKFLRGTQPPLTDDPAVRSALADILERLAPKPHHRAKYSKLQKQDARAQLEVIDRLIDSQLAQIPERTNSDGSKMPGLEDIDGYAQMSRAEIRKEILQGKARMIRALAKRSGIRETSLKELAKTRSK